jgi:nicotinate phosphoribosyltransferase
MSFDHLPCKPSLALLTDFYQLTMAYAYWKSGKEKLEAAFHLFFRENPFHGGYTVAAGLEQVIDYLNHFSFSQGDLEYLASVTGNDGKPIFETGFLEYLGKLGFGCDIHAVEEGRVIFPHEPLIRVEGPIIEGQLLETVLLNLMNFPTLIATKAARVTHAAGGDPVLEFGLRRAQGIDGGLTASRAAYLGGCVATSNVLAGKLYSIPVKGTHAHSWVMAFDDETEAFRAYARTMPNNAVFLVDTYDTLEGIKNAIEVGREMREKGSQLIGIRLDSGDLAYLSIRAREMLDDAGFKEVGVFASNDLDESLLESLKAQGAKIGVWGVGTRLVTAYDQPALGGVYKLSAIRNPGEVWQPKIKISEQSIKISNPGIQQVRRFYSKNNTLADVIFDVEVGVGEGCTLVDPLDMTRQKKIRSNTEFEDLLVPIFKKGKQVYVSPTLEDSRAKLKKDLSRFSAGVKRFVNPHWYPVGLEKSLHSTKTQLILNFRESQS